MRKNLQELTNKRWFIGLVMGFTFLSGLLISFAGFPILGNIGKPLALPTANSFSRATPAPINKNNPQEGVYNALLLGYGGGNHEGTLLTDSIIVAHVDTNTKKAALISIPRDLWIPGNIKINAAGVNGFQNSSPAVQNVTGLPINYYVAVDFNNFRKLIDNLGGITVSVPKTFDDPFYPIEGEENNTCGMNDAQIFELKNKFGQSGFELEKQFTCRYEHLHFDAGQNVHLDGASALKFVRSRHGDSDFGRSERQFAVLTGILSRLVSLRNVNKIDETVNTLFNMVKTDLNLGTIKTLAQVFGEPGVYKISQIQLTTDNVLKEGYSANGSYVLMPKSGEFDFTGVKNYINTWLQ